MVFKGRGVGLCNGSKGEATRQRRREEKNKTREGKRRGRASKRRVSYEFFRRHMTWKKALEISAPGAEPRSIILTTEESR